MKRNTLMLGTEIRLCSQKKRQRKIQKVRKDKISGFPCQNSDALLHVSKGYKNSTILHIYVTRRTIHSQVNEN